MMYLTQRQEFIHHTVLVLVLLLVKEAVTIRQAVQTWRCSGRESLRTNTDCLILAAQSGSGCYLDTQLERYKSCPRICNDADVATLAEYSCKQRCPEYLRENCELKSADSTTSEEVPTTRVTRYVTESEYHEDEVSNPESTWMIMVSVMSALAVILLLLAVFLMTAYRTMSKDSQWLPPIEGAEMADNEKSSILICQESDRACHTVGASATSNGKDKFVMVSVNAET